MSEHCAASGIKMANHKILLQPAYVLHQRAYRDTSVLLELFSPEYGRVGVIARGVKSAKSRWRGVLQPFQPLLVSWNQRGELGTLTGAEIHGPVLAIAPDLIASGFYLNEVLLRLLERDEGQLELFGSYDEALRGLDKIGAEINAEGSSRSVALEILLRQFEMRLLTALGYGLVLNQEVGTESPLQAEQEYIYQLENGPVKVETGFTDVSKASDVSEGEYRYGIRISGGTLLALDAGDFSDERVRVESKRLLRNVLRNYLGSKPLQSRNLVQPINRH
jgi:DNA repair protein RecO (recombination protein O)